MNKKTKYLLATIIMLFSMAFPAVASADNTISSSSIEKAINYAYDEKSTRPDYWKGYCAAFVWACYNKGAGISNRSYPTAREMGDALITHTDSNPPRGALVFWYKTANPYGHAGHVGLSLGDGTVIHAYSSIKVTSISTVNNGGYTYRGWGAPISGYTLETETPPSELTLTGAVYPSGHYDSLPNFGLRGIFSSPGTITEINAKIATQSGNVHMSYNKKWNSSIYNIQSDGLNNQFTFRDLPDGFYQYYVEAKDNYGKTASVSSWFSIGSVTYTINYDANGGIGAPSNQTKIHDTVLTLSSTRPTRSNSNAGSFAVTLNANGGSVNTSSLSAARTTSYTFKNWNTAADGSETSYNVGASYSENAAATLYAQWNSSTSTAAVTLPTPTRVGYIFKGWSTSSTATSGITGSYTPTGNVTLYAAWETDPDFVKPGLTIDRGQDGVYYLNEPTVIVLNTDTEIYDSCVLKIYRTPESGETYLYWEGQIFSPEYSTNNSQVGYYSCCVIVTKDKSSTESTWVGWTVKEMPHTFSFATNDGSGEMQSFQAIIGENITFPACTFIRDGYSFQGWNAYRVNDGKYHTGMGWKTPYEINAEGLDKTLYPDQLNFDFNTTWTVKTNGPCTFTMFSVWTPNTYTITYNTNGGTGAPEAQTKTHGQPLTLSSTVPTRAGFTFLGWAESEDATTATYQPGGEFVKNADTTLYAVWQKKEPDFTLPAALKEIGEEAFADCAFSYVHIPDGVTRIERRAFADCPNLRDVDIPESATSIDPTAFAGTSGLTIHGADGSYAEFYAGKYGFDFIPVA